MVSEVIVESEADFKAWIEAEQSKSSAPINSGRDLFIVIGCNACHSLGDADAIGIVGPALDGMRELAMERQPGIEPEEYVLTSIMDPDAFLVEGYQAGLMPKDYGERLSETEIQTLTDYLLEQ
jgi:hypothetical protein